MEVTLLFISFESKYHENEIWFNTSVSCNKHLQHVFGSIRILETSSRTFYDFNEMTI